MPARLPDLSALDADSLAAFARDLGQPAFRGRQLYRWVYGSEAGFEQMTNLPKALREQLPAVATLGRLVESRRQVASDGTTKCLFRLPSGREIESVLIPALRRDGSVQRLTVCVSSQVGCAMGCTFCATGLMGFKENLTAGQITEQVARMSAIAEERYGRAATNVVFMGMGEPLQNYAAVAQSLRVLTDPDLFGLGARRITVSTVGLARRIVQFADDQTAGRIPKVGLAISLHAPTDAQRSAIMPVNRSEKTDLGALREAVRHFHALTGNRVTYEYCLFDGVNDRAEDAEHLARVTRWAPSKVNLIVYNPVAGTGFGATDERRIDRFVQQLIDRRVTVTVRRSRGQDIDAACGQLAVLGDTESEEEAE